MTHYKSLYHHGHTCFRKGKGGLMRNADITYKLFCSQTSYTLSDNAHKQRRLHPQFSSTSGGETEQLNGNKNNVDEDRRRVKATHKWLESIVIGKKLCPFAPPVSRAPKLRIHASRASTYDDIVCEISTELQLLVGTDKHVKVRSPMSSSLDKTSDLTATTILRPETTLIVLNERLCPPLLQFENLVRLSWRIQSEAIVEKGLLGKLQIVLFHPHASHNTYSSQDIDDESDAANYTIRSPYPTIHLLREDDIMRAVKSGFPDLEGLPSRNKAAMRADGLQLCKERLKSCNG